MRAFMIGGRCGAKRERQSVRYFRNVKMTTIPLEAAVKPTCCWAVLLRGPSSLEPPLLEPIRGLDSSLVYAMVQFMYLYGSGLVHHRVELCLSRPPFRCEAKRARLSYLRNITCKHTLLRIFVEDVFVGSINRGGLFQA